MREASQNFHLILMPVDGHEWWLQAARHGTMKFVSPAGGN
jgi:hypothetical protein